MTHHPFNLIFCKQALSKFCLFLNVHSPLFLFSLSIYRYIFDFIFHFPTICTHPVPSSLVGVSAVVADHMEAYRNESKVVNVMDVNEMAGQEETFELANMEIYV